MPIVSTLIAAVASNDASGPPSAPKIDRIVCLGLGSMESIAIGASRARAQFAFLLLLSELFHTAAGADNKIQLAICEPMFTAQDAALARHLGIQLLENRSGRYSQLEPLPVASASSAPSSSALDVTASSGTLYWMPHCPKELYASLLHFNWNLSALNKTVIIGNSFADIVEGICPPAEKLRLGRIFAAHEISTASSLPNYADDPYIFNNTSVHLFSATLDGTSWTIPAEETATLELCLNDPTLSFQGPSSSNNR